MGAGPGHSTETDSGEENAKERARRRGRRMSGTTGDDIDARERRSTSSHAGPKDRRQVSALTLDDVNALPPGALDPGGFEFSPDDQHVAYLQGHLPHDHASGWTTWTLFVLDVSSGTRHACFDPTSASARDATETDASRERLGDVGVTRYEWASEATNPSRLLVPRPEGAYVVDVEKTPRPDDNDDDDAKSPDRARRLPTTRVSSPRCVARGCRDAPVLDASVSPDGRWVAFVRRSEMYVAPCDAGGARGETSTPQLEVRVTHGARGRPFVTHGLAEYVAAEEMRRDRGFWWRPDSGALAFARVDASRVETVDVARGYRLGAESRASDASEDDVPRALKDETHSYPHPGGENARVTLGVVDVSWLTLERNAEKRDALLRLCADANGEDKERFPVTWMDVDCGSARLGTAGSRGEREEYLASVAWTPSPSARRTPRERRSAAGWVGFPRRVAATFDAPPARERSARRDSLLVRVQNRAQTELSSTFIDAATGERDSERDCAGLLERVEDDADAWVNIKQTPIVLRAGNPARDALPGDAVCVSERDGYAHAYLVRVGKNRAPPTQLTAGAWCVYRVHAVDEDRGWVYFTANERGPLERHFYRTRLWPSANGSSRGTNSRRLSDGDAKAGVAPPVRLTRGGGFHTVALDHAFARFVDVREDLRTPPVAATRRILRSIEDDDRDEDEKGRDRDARDEEGSASSVSPRARVDAASRATTAVHATTIASYEAPTLVRLPAADGVTTLYGAVYLPDAETHGEGPYPCVVAVYGGPGAQCVTDSWRLTADARAQRLRSKGIATLKLDNRGSANRGCVFERAIRRGGAVLGDVETADQVAGVAFLVSRKLVDARKVVIVGWSYGGFVAAAAALRHPETFACAVVGAPVTSWLAYNAHYAERYLGAPEAPRGAERYERCDLLAAARERAARGGWRGHLAPEKKKMLIVHGASDENVHLSHTARLVRALDALDNAASAENRKMSGEGRERRANDAFATRGDAEKPVSSSRVDVRSTEAGDMNTRSSSFEVAVFARERHVPRGRAARRALEARIDAFLERAFE